MTTTALDRAHSKAQWLERELREAERRIAELDAELDMIVAIKHRRIAALEDAALNQIDGMKPPEVTHVGMTQGCWPVVAFTDENQAALWAAEKPSVRRVWGVLNIRLGPELMGETVPAEAILKPSRDSTP